MNDNIETDYRDYEDPAQSNEPCPECGDPLYIYTQQNLAHDFDTIGECRGCGYTEST